MQTVQWGKAMWIPLHAITFNYPLQPTQQDKNTYKQYFKFTAQILPCKYCRESFTSYAKYIPIDSFLDSREGLVYWLYVIHNLVNNKLYKPTSPLCEVVVIYEKMRAKCGKVKKNNVLAKNGNYCGYHALYHNKKKNNLTTIYSSRERINTIHYYNSCFENNIYLRHTIKLS